MSIKLHSITELFGDRICVLFDDYMGNTSQAYARLTNDGSYVMEALDADGDIIFQGVLDLAGKLLASQGYLVKGTTPESLQNISELLESHNNHYTLDENGDDLIARWAKRYSIEEFRVLMWAMMEKYNDRLGKKDEPYKEVAKIATFAARWAKIEDLK